MNVKELRDLHREIAELKQAVLDRNWWIAEYLLNTDEIGEALDKAEMFDWLVSELQASGLQMNGQAYYRLPSSMLRFPAGSGELAIKKAFEMRVAAVEHAGELYVTLKRLLRLAQFDPKTRVSRKRSIQIIRDLQEGWR